MRNLRGGKFLGQGFDQEIKFIASHVYDLTPTEVSLLSAEDLNQILMHPSLAVVDDDSLWNVLSGRIEADP
jgi:hypothetical protein